MPIHLPRRYRASLKFWPGCLPVAARQRVGATPAGADGFDLSLTLVVDGAAVEAGAATLRAAAAMAGLALPNGGACTARVNPSEGLDAYEPQLDLRNLPVGAPMSLWRTMDGWIVVHTAAPQAWRTFCATFLSLGMARWVEARNAWSDVAVNALATTVLDTHRTVDCVGACLTYGAPAAVVEGWRDAQAPVVSKALSDRLAWAALEQLPPPA